MARKMISTIVTWFKSKLSKKHKDLSGNTLASATTVVVVKFGSGIVLGTDGLLVATEFGLVTDDMSTKIAMVGEWIAVGCSGDAIFVSNLTTHLARDLAGRERSVKEVAREVKVRMEKHVRQHSTLIQILVVGRENNNWPVIKLETDKKYPIVLETRVDDDVRYATVGSGSKLVRTFLNVKRMADYPLTTKDPEKRKEVVLEALKYAVRRDWGSGGRLHLVSIDLENGYTSGFEYQKGGSGCCDSAYMPLDE